MCRIPKAIPALLLSLVATQAAAIPTTYRGITFPQGDISFADAVVDDGYSPGQAISNPDYDDPTQALGVPDWGADIGAVSLGRSGSLTLRFLDNVLTGSGTSDDDLHIFEIGAAVEGTFVSISQDGESFLEVGGVDGAVSSIDIDPFLLVAGLDWTTAEFRYVRLTDDGGNLYTNPEPGPDIDAVGAISTRAAPPPPPGTSVPEPGSLVLVLLGALGLWSRRNV